MDSIKDLYSILITISKKSNSQYFELIELSSYEKFYDEYKNNEIFCNSIYRFMINISRDLNIELDKIFYIRNNDECIKGACYYANKILDCLNNQDKASD